MFTSLTSKSEVFLIALFIFICKLFDNSLITAFSFTFNVTYTFKFFSSSNTILDVTSCALSKPFTTLFTNSSKVVFDITN